VTAMLSWLADPLAYPFMVRGLTASVTVGIVCSVLGTYIVLRGMAVFRGRRWRTRFCLA